MMASARPQSRTTKTPPMFWTLRGCAFESLLLSCKEKCSLSFVPLIIHVLHTFFKGDFFGFFLYFMYYIQHSFICRPSNSTVSEDAGIELWTVATTTLAVRRCNHSARSHPLHPILLHINITNLIRIRSGLNTNPDPAFHLNASPDAGSQVNEILRRSGSASDLGQALLSTKFKFYIKNIPGVGIGL
jgi:hypothetical protein